MTEKSWDDMSVDEKLNEVHQIIKDFIPHSDRNALATNAAINGIHHRWMGIEGDLDQLKKDVAALRGKAGSP